MTRSTLCRHARMRYSKRAPGLDDGTQVRRDNLRCLRDHMETILCEKEVRAQAIPLCTVSARRHVHGGRHTHYKHKPFGLSRPQ